MKFDKLLKSVKGLPVKTPFGMGKVIEIFWDKGLASIELARGCEYYLDTRHIRLIYQSNGTDVVMIPVK